MSDTVIDRRFRGPPTSANGGYACGAVAAHVGACAEVTLHRPPPLDAPLDVVERGTEVSILHGGDLVATGRPAELEPDVPQAPSFAEAEAAAVRYAGHHGHLFPECFVCGPDRADGDGLRLFPGTVDGGLVAAPWRPNASVCGSDGHVHAACVWAALDCPSYFGIAAAEGVLPLALLGRLTGKVLAAPRTGEACVVLGWPVKLDGRKLHGGSAVVSEARGLLAYARATWIRVERLPEG